MNRLIRDLDVRATAAAIVVVGALTAPSSALGQAYGDRGWMWNDGWGWGHMVFGGLFMIIFWGAIVVLAVMAFRWLGRGHGEAPHEPRRTAIDILKERYARGDIDKEEFLERRRHLSE